MDELLGLPYMDEKFEMSSFSPNWNHNKTPLVALNMAKKHIKVLSSRFTTC